MESVSKITIFGLKIMVKRFFFSILPRVIFAQNYEFTNKNKPYEVVSIK